MREPTIARNYAETLLALASKANDLEGWGAMMTDVADAVETDSSLRHFLESPRIDKRVKNEVLGKAFADRLPRSLLRFLQAVVSHRRERLIPQIATEYQVLVDEKEGRVHAQVTTAREADEALRDVVSTQLARTLGRKVVTHYTVNPAILGGVVVRVGDTVMDGSVRRRLGVLRTRMLHGAAR
jgi:F-type H+-transporting ATPase subunit delta